MTEEKMSFEKAYAELEKAATEINNDNTSLEKALESYKKGRKYYEYCMSILEDARQTVEIYDKQSDTLHKEQ